METFILLFASALLNFTGAMHSQYYTTGGSSGVPGRSLTNPDDTTNLFYRVPEGSRIFILVSSNLKLSGTLEYPQGRSSYNSVYGYVTVGRGMGMTKANLKVHYVGNGMLDDIRKEIDDTSTLTCFIARENELNLKTELKPQRTPLARGDRARVSYIALNADRVVQGDLVPAGRTFPDWITPDMLRTNDWITLDMLCNNN